MPKFYIGKDRYIVQVDRDDYKRVMQYKWAPHFSDTNVYASRRVRCKETRKLLRIYLHRWLLGVTDRKVFVDHGNRDGLDCRKKNMELVDCNKNNQNKTKGMARYAKILRKKGDK